MSDFNGYNNNYEYGGGYTYYADENEGMDARRYNLTISACLFWGFFFNYLICRFCTPFFYRFAANSYLIFILAYFVCAFAGIAVLKRAKSAVPAFIGYNLMALPVGGVLSVILVGYSTTIIQYAFLATTLIALMMGVMSYFYPQAFLSMGKMLGISLISVIVVELILTLIFRTSITAIDYVVAIIFALYIGYDLAKAQRKQYTTVNAIASAADLYLDLINLFIRILSIIGRNSRRN